MIRPKLTDLESFAKEYKLVPICKEIYADIITPITLLRKLSRISQQYFLLESVEGGEKWGRYSFLGFDPSLQVSCKKGVLTIKEGEKQHEIHLEEQGDPFEILRDILADYKSPKMQELPPFTGGFVGYFSYEMIGHTERKLKIKNSDYKDFDLMLFDKVIAYDHLKQKISIIVNVKTDQLSLNYDTALNEIEKIEKIIYEPLDLIEVQAKNKVQFSSNISKEDYCQMVERTKEFIVRGDIYQAVISRCFTSPYQGSLINAYRVLRTSNPSPYMVFLQNGEIEIMASSPETLVRIKDGKVVTFPIAGSRPRGKDTNEDLLLETQLMQDDKELAEHNMLVDLARNDIGRVAKLNTVKLTRYKEIQKFSKIMHITSEVEGDLREDQDAFHALKAILPAGTLSGAPKIRACEIIDELEHEARGIYGGAIGYIDFTGNMDTCIAIRMAVKKDDRVSVQVGAGIVADSIPEKEYEETQNKAKAVIEAIEKESEVEEYGSNY
ncbi:MAG TPA: anthranilate synthase component I [Clostridiales bacterium]|nr:anthranilate synthase component I [Clostridiales bacterium]